MDIRKVLLLTILALGCFIVVLQIISLASDHWKEVHYKQIYGRQMDAFNPNSIWTRNDGIRITFPKGLWNQDLAAAKGSGATAIISLLLLFSLIFLTILQLLHLYEIIGYSFELNLCLFEKVGIEFASFLFAIISLAVFLSEVLPNDQLPLQLPKNIFLHPDETTSGWALNLQVAVCIFHAILLTITILETLHHYNIFFPKVSEESKNESASETIGNPGFQKSSPKSKEKQLNNTDFSEDFKTEPGEFINPDFRSSSPKLHRTHGNGQILFDPEQGFKDVETPVSKEDSLEQPVRNGQDTSLQSSESETRPKSDLQKSSNELIYVNVATPPISAERQKRESQPIEKTIYADIKHSVQSDSSEINNTDNQNKPIIAQRKRNSSTNSHSLPKNNNNNESIDTSNKSEIIDSKSSSVALHETDL